MACNALHQCRRHRIPRSPQSATWVANASQGLSGYECLFQDPRGLLDFSAEPQSPVNPTFADQRPTYFFGQPVMHAASSLTIHGRYPNARYFKLNLFKFERNTFVAIPPGLPMSRRTRGCHAYSYSSRRLDRDLVAGRNRRCKAACVDPWRRCRDHGRRVQMPAKTRTNRPSPLQPRLMPGPQATAP